MSIFVGYTTEEAENGQEGTQMRRKEEMKETGASQPLGWVMASNIRNKSKRKHNLACNKWDVVAKVIERHKRSLWNSKEIVNMSLLY